MKIEIFKKFYLLDIKFTIIIFNFLLIIFCSFQTASAQHPFDDVIYLKDGSVVRGVIIGKIPGKYIKIQQMGGIVKTIEYNRIKKISKEPLRGSLLAEEKDPLMACMFSMILPGTGQYYNGEIAKGITQEALIFGGILLSFTAGLETKTVNYNDYGDFPPYQSESETKITPWFWIGWGISIGTYFWSIVDAPLSTIRINKRNRQIRYPNNAMSLNLNFKRNITCVQLSLNF